MSVQKDTQAYLDKLAAIRQRDAPAAISAALNKTQAKASTRIIRGVSKSAKVPAKLIRKKLYKHRAKPKKPRARIYIYRNDISPNALKAKQNHRRGGGVRAGKHYWKGAFFGPQGQVFKRRGQARLPIDVKRIRIANHVETIAPRVSRRLMKTEFWQLLNHEINYRINKHAK